MQVGSLYSCKWTSYLDHHTPVERGWDMLMFLGTKGSRYYHFYDIMRGEECVLDDGIIKHCKEITKEVSCK